MMLGLGVFGLLGHLGRMVSADPQLHQTVGREGILCVSLSLALPPLTLGFFNYSRNPSGN